MQNAVNTHNEISQVSQNKNMQNINFRFMKKKKQEIDNMQLECEFAMKK